MLPETIIFHGSTMLVLENMPSFFVLVKADQKAEEARKQRAEEERIYREEEMRDIAIKLRKR
jgi:hypothetical protein